MKYGNHRIWQVSININSKRKYFYFSSLAKATRFIKTYVADLIDDTGYPPVCSMNIQVYKSCKLPKTIDNMPFDEWCKLYNYGAQS